MSANSKLFLHDHPVSSYAQKIRIALREKGIPFDFQTPKGLGSGQKLPELEAGNPRLEVPVLEDGDFKIFDSTVILGYLEDKYPEKPLLPKDPRERAVAKMIEEVMDTHYEAVNWGYGEVEWCERATGELAEKLKKQVEHQTATLQSWLAEKLEGREYFNGSTFGYADLCVAPVLNRSVHYGYGPASGTSLARWHARIKQRSSVSQTFDEMEAGAKLMSANMKRMFIDGPNKREYRDHRLEWMVKSGGIDIVTEGLRRDNIRFAWPDAKI